MPNMSYCRFENTLRDLKDCVDHLDDCLSESECDYRETLIALCVEIALDYGHEIGRPVIYIN